MCRRISVSVMPKQSNTVIQIDWCTVCACIIHRCLWLFLKPFYVVRSNQTNRQNTKQCSIVSPFFSLFFLFLRKEQFAAFSTLMCVYTTFIANILCSSLIWNHFSFISWIFFFFLGGEGAGGLGWFFSINIPVDKFVHFGLLLLTHFVHRHPACVHHSKGVHPFVYYK